MRKPWPFLLSGYLALAPGLASAQVRQVPRLRARIGAEGPAVRGQVHGAGPSIPAGGSLVLPGSVLAGAQIPAAEAPSPSPAPEETPKPEIDAVARITGSVTRRHPDPGPVRRMWFVHEKGEDTGRFRHALEAIRRENPGVEIAFYEKDQVLSWNDEDKKQDGLKVGRELYGRILKEEADFVLASNHDIYDGFRRLRDRGFADTFPFGFAGRRYVSVDIPRSSLDPGVLSDPRRYPHENYLILGASSKAPPATLAGMRGISAGMEEVLEAGERALKGAASESGGEGRMMDIMGRVGMWISGQSDSREVRALRLKAQALAAYIEEREVHALVLDNPEDARVAAEMKREGYHVGLPVIWRGAGHPGDASGLNQALTPADWLSQAPHVRLASEPVLEKALEEAKSLVRLPDNFDAEGGVGVQDYEAAVTAVLDRGPAPAATQGAHPLLSAKGRHEIVFLLSSGNGRTAKGNLNPFGHFGMAVKGEDGRHRVWTVQYNDEGGGSFAGGLEETQLTMGEYLYGLHYLSAAEPRASGQAAAMGETPVGPVYGFVLKNITEGQLERMREMAAAVSARHLAGLDRYDFTNKGFLTNCISLVTQILRASFFPVGESGTQVPADKAVELIQGFARRLLDNQISPWDIDFLVFERPEHAGSSYRIPNVPLGSPLFGWTKPWSKMTWPERLGRIFNRRLLAFLHIPQTIEGFARMATTRLIVGPNSRVLEPRENAESPIRKLQAVSDSLARLDAESVGILEDRRRLEKSILAKLGLKDWRRNPGGTLEELARESLSGGAVNLAAPERESLESELGRHHDLDVRLALNSMDQLREQHRNLFYRIILADPRALYAGRLAPVGEAYDGAVALRKLLEKERRLPTAAEKARLGALNERVHLELRDIRMRLLRELGHSPPMDVELILSGQVTRDLLESLRDEALGAGGGKKRK